MRAVMLAAAVAVGLAAAGCGDDGSPAAGSASDGETTHPRPVSGGYCLLAAGVQEVSRAGDLTFAAHGTVIPHDSGRTGVGKATASFKGGGDYIYVVAKQGQTISQAVVLRSPSTYEFVGVLQAPEQSAVAKADDCLDGLIGNKP